MNANTPLNESDVAELRAFREMAARDASKADRNPVLTAHWVGGSRSRVEFGDKVTHLNGDGDFNAMQMLLAALAACDVDLVAMHASFLGLPVESLSVEVTGHFNVRAYLGLEDTPGSGYDRIAYTVRISAPGATPEQIAYLRERCERSSPVGDSLARAIPLTLAFEANE
ncbi:MAG: OsmC family protein [Chloroflexi bacterium]|nr:OsmC family protein [Chloroflexota bacterium]